MSRPTKFQIMRGRRVRPAADRCAQLVAQINALEAEMTREWWQDSTLRHVQENLARAREREITSRRRWWHFFTRRGLA